MFGVLYTLWCIATYLSDIGTDIWLAYTYWTLGHHGWFKLTLSFIVTPAIVTTVFSIARWRCSDCKATKCRWFFRIISILFMITPLILLIEMLIDYLSESASSNRKCRIETGRHTMASVHLFEAYLECGPQLVLQLYVMQQQGLDENSLLYMVQIAGLITSLVTMTSSLVQFYLLRKGHEKYGIAAWVGLFIWRVFCLTARVLALALFAGVFKEYTLVFVAGHFLMMFVWFAILDQNDICDNMRMMPLNIFYHLVIAYVYTFEYVDIIKGHTRLRYIAYYVITYTENIFLIMLWYWYSQAQPAPWYEIPALVFVIGGFWVGIMALLMFYGCCHKSQHGKDIRCCVPWSNLSCIKPPEEGDRELHPL